MARKHLNRYSIRCYLYETCAAGAPKKRFVTQDAATPTAALKHALHYLELAGVTDIRSIQISRPGVPVAEYKRSKPPMHKSKAYAAVYDGMTCKGYKHLETGVMISREDYQNL